MKQIFNSIGKAFRYLVRLPAMMFGLPQRLLSVSFPMRIAVVVGIFIWLLAITAFIGFVVNRQQNTPDTSEWFENWQQFLLVLGLLIAIPVIVYHALRLWLEPDVSRYPDIDRAWKDGLHELRQNGLDPGQIPMFLVLGGSNEQEVSALMAASNYGFIVDGVPDARVPLRWYANDQAIFLVCQGMGCLGRFTQAANADRPQPMVGGAAAASSGGDIKSTLVIGGNDASSPAASITDTSIPDSPSDYAATGDAIRGTLVTGNVADTYTPGDGGTTSASPSGRVLSHQELDDESDQLRYVCDLVYKSRQPLCALNGILVLISGRLIESSRFMVAARELPETIRRDLVSVMDVTRLRCPVTALVTGMETEPGFVELMQRLGAKKTQEARFGKGFKLWNDPSSRNLDALTSHVCGAFEDWVYALFRDKDALGRDGNGKLYAMLCKVRSRWQSRLRSIFLKGFGTEADETPILFGGCYFAATSNASDKQGFVGSALDKMLQQEEELEWTDEALVEDARFHRLASIGMWVNGGLILALAGLAAYGFGLIG